jgi:DNA-binding NarL/FixJ family response regulator
VRDTRVIYVENDAALRGFISRSLRAAPGIDVVLEAGSADAAFNSTWVTQADAALLDLALGVGEMNGIDLGLALREKNPNIGIVIYSQHAVSDFTDSLPEQMRWGWSVLQKRSDLDLESLVDVLRSTAQGHNTVDDQILQARADYGQSPIERLSARQREVMAIAATGVDATVIAEELGLAPVTVREHLSRAYQVLVPDPKPGTDLRTTAVLRYLRETRRYAQSAEE